MIDKLHIILLEKEAISITQKKNKKQQHIKNIVVS